MPLPGPTYIPPIGEQTDPDNVRVAAVIGGQLASAPARGFGLTTEELAALQALTAQPVVATAEARNRLVNPAMQISQENGNTAVTLAGYYPVDQWSADFNTAVGVIASQRVQVVTPNGSQNRLRRTVTTADTSLAAGEHLYTLQPVEGIRIADFRWGTASARQVVARFGFKGPAGTYCFGISNGPFNRQYHANFTISAGQANTDTEQVFVVPGDTTGTWPIDSNTGLYFYITLACGTTNQGVVGWQAGATIGTAAVSNGMATVGNVFELFDVSLHLDANNTGLAPPWQMPDEAQELAACKRYYMKLGQVVDTSTISQAMTYPVAMRIAPSITGGGAGFTNAGVTGTSSWLYQTTRGYVTLTYTARM